jgi:hypothetical protein
VNLDSLRVKGRGDCTILEVLLGSPLICSYRVCAHALCSLPAPDAVLSGAFSRIVLPESPPSPLPQVSHAVNFKTVEPASGSSAENVDRLRVRVKELEAELGALTEEVELAEKLKAMVDRLRRGLYLQPGSCARFPHSRPSYLCTRWGVGGVTMRGWCTLSANRVRSSAHVADASPCFFVMVSLD